jgi:phosphoribosylamine--glycine ligase
MKYLFVSLDGLIADIAWHVVQEGHDVKFYINDPGEKEIADGFVPKTDNWERDADWADLVVFDDVLGQGTHSDCASPASSSWAARRTPIGSRTTARSASRN